MGSNITDRTGQQQTRWDGGSVGDMWGRECWDSHVYFIQAGAFVKIGRAVDVASRLRELQVGCPYQMILAGVVHGGHKEAWAHTRLADYHVRGEWFLWSPPVIERVSAWIRREGSLRRPGYRKAPTKRRISPGEVRAALNKLPNLLDGIRPRAQDS